MRRNVLVTAVFLALFALAFTPPVAAEKGDKQVRFGLLYSSPTDDFVQGMQTTELDDTLGFGASFEYMLTDRLGIEPGVSSTGFDIMVVEPGFPTETGEADMIGLTVNFNFHFVRDSGLDCYVGPTIGYALWDDITLSSFATPVETDDELMFGANFGLDVPIGDGGWAFNVGLAYIFVDLPALGGDIGVSPIQAKAGVGYSF